MPIETVQLVVTGANPQTRNLTVTLDANGNGSVSFPVLGTNPGLDSLIASITNGSLALTSNATQVTWQPTNGPIAVAPFATYSRANNSGEFPAGLPMSAFTPGSLGSVLSSNTGGSEGGGMDYIFSGSFVVSAAGTIAFSALVNSVFVIGVQGASFVSGPQYFGGVNTTPANGYTALAGSNGSPWPGGSYATWNFSLNFPAPGIYPFEICYTTGFYRQKQFTLSANGGGIPSVVLITPPASPAAGTGVLTLNPPTAGPDVIGTTQLVTATVTGLTFLTKPYIGLLEGTPGDVFIYNSAAANLFTLPSIGGSTPDPTAAAADIFSLKGDNASFQGRVGVAWSGTQFSLHYNGNAFDPNVATTQLTVTEDDIAWYNPTTKAFDLYAPSGQGGGTATEVELDYFVMPTVASTVPSSVPADGLSHTFMVNFSKPFPPYQVSQGITPSVVGTGGLTVTNTVPNLDTNGWMTGLTVTATAQGSSGNIAAVLTINVTGTLTYLNGSNFTTGTVNYITNVASNITLTGIGGSGWTPKMYAWSVTSLGEAASVYGISTSVTIACTILATLNNYGNAAFQVSYSGAAFTALGTAAPTNIRQSNGLWLADYTFTHVVTPTSTYNFNLTEVHADGTTLAYTDTNTYEARVNVPINPVGCPSVEMFVHEDAQVMQIGLSNTPPELDCLEDDFATVASHKVQSINYFSAECIAFRTANGAEVVVSETTPVPTTEALALIASGHGDTAPSLATDIHLGMHLFTLIDGVLGTSEVVEVHAAGCTPVARINVGGRNFAAGKTAGKRIFTHNSVLNVK